MQHLRASTERRLRTVLGITSAAQEDNDLRLVAEAIRRGGDAARLAIRSVAQAMLDFPGANERSAG